MKIEKECATFSSGYNEDNKTTIANLWYKLVNLDITISEKLNAKGSDSKKKIGATISLFGFYLIWIISVIISIISHQFYIILIIGISISITIIVILPIKRVINRCRPIGRNLITNKYLKPKSASFPSGHTFFAILTGLIIGIYLGNSFILIIAFLLGILVGYSRIYLGVHYFSDVLFSYLLASLIGTIFILIHNLF